MSERGGDEGRVHSPVHVVVADDHGLSRRQLAEALERHPALRVVGQAANGREAVRLASELSPDVVLMDIRMPVMDGLQATAEIRAATGVAVVLVSSYDSALYEAAAGNVGAAAYLAKSAREADLVAAVIAAAAP